MKQLTKDDLTELYIEMLEYEELYEKFLFLQERELLPGTDFFPFEEFVLATDRLKNRNISRYGDEKNFTIANIVECENISYDITWKTKNWQKKWMYDLLWFVRNKHYLNQILELYGDYFKLYGDFCYPEVDQSNCYSRHTKPSIYFSFGYYDLETCCDNRLMLLKAVEATGKKICDDPSLFYFHTPKQEKIIKHNLPDVIMDRKSELFLKNSEWLAKTAQTMFSYELNIKTACSTIECGFREVQKNRRWSPDKMDLPENNPDQFGLDFFIPFNSFTYQNCIVDGWKL